MALGDIISVGAAAVDMAGGIGGVVDIAQDLLGNSDRKKGPLRGARLEYEISVFGGRLLMKEPIGNWFGLTPYYPEYGAFKSSKNSAINGKLFTKRPGFRFKSFTVLLKPGTKIETPKDTAAEQRSGKNSGTEERQMGNISIGVSSDISVNEFIDFLKDSQQTANINGIITPSLRKHQWAGVMQRASNGPLTPF